MNTTNAPINQPVPSSTRGGPRGPGNPQHCLNCAAPLGAGTWVCDDLCGAEFIAWVEAQPTAPDPDKR